MYQFLSEYTKNRQNSVVEEMEKFRVRESHPS